MGSEWRAGESLSAISLFILSLNNDRAEFRKTFANFNLADEPGDLVESFWIFCFR